MGSGDALGIMVYVQRCILLYLALFIGGPWAPLGSRIRLRCSSSFMIRSASLIRFAITTLGGCFLAA